MTAQPTVCFVSRKWPPAMGGMETYAEKLSLELGKRCNIKRIVLPGNADGSTPSAVQLAGFGLRTAARLLFTRNPAGVTHIADMASWPLAAVARLRSRKSRIVLSAHGTDVSFSRRKGFWGNLYGAYMWVGARLLRNAMVLANSAATASCTSGYGFRGVQVIPLAAEGPVPAERRPKSSILFSGRLVPLKGCRWFIENVLPLLPEDITLDVAGTAWDAHELAALDHPRVTYLGLLDQATLWQAYADALCVVLPNIKQPTGQFEGFGLVAVEAASAGGVVLASRHGGLVEAVIDGQTGMLINEGDAEAWAAKINEVARWSEQDRAAHGQRVQALAAQHFTWARVADQTLAAYGLSGTSGD